MTAQKNHAIGHPAFRDGPSRRGRGHATTALIAAALVGCVVPAAGCKTGTAFTKPSWWAFGGAPKADAESLAAAPPYGGEIKKPSESAKQYPTTSTPSGYVITGSTSPASSVAQPFQAAQPQAPVVYGTTPPPSMSAAAVAAAPPAAAMPQQPAPSSIAPQVGPYATLNGDSIPPPGQPLPPIAPSTGTGTAMATTAATPAETALPNTAYSSFSAPTASPLAGSPPGPRMADARAADPAAALPAAALPSAALPPEQPAYGGSRYSASTGSRFGGTEAASFSPAASSSPESGLSPSAPASPFGGSPAVAPQGAPTTPGLLQPSAQPVRRPDPGYRPGGTSSYRPSRTILADESSPAAAVRTASYEEAPGTIQQ